MSITDQLREWARDNTVEGEVLTSYPVRHPIRGTLETLLGIADRIDAEHERACGEAYGNGVQSVALPDMTAYVKLPVDADGVPIHVGDSVEIIGGEYGTAVAIELCEDGGWNVSMRPTGWDTPTLFAAESVRHYRPPTVEDVLREFAEKVIDSQVPTVRPTYDECIAEYAKRLRLKEDE